MGIRPAGRDGFFLAMAIACLAIALTGFSTTYFLPLSRGTFGSPPVVVHLHGAACFAWLAFLIAQATLVRRRNLHLHRRLGWLGAGIATAIVVTGVLVGSFATRRDLAAMGEDPFVLGQFVNILVEMALFGGLVALAIRFRRDGATHKRLMLLATISALAPAWLRLRHLLPMVPHPFVTFSILADSLLLVAMLRDRIVLGRIHPAYWWAGGAMVAIHAIELLAITSAPWLRLSRALLGLD